MEKLPDVFSGKTPEQQEVEHLRREKEQLIHKIGEQAVDIDFLKKNLKKLNLL